MPISYYGGLQSDDASYGQTGVILAELLGIPHATIVIEVDRASLGDTLRVKRELESGWYQWFTYKLPSLLTIQSGISQIRYASLKGIMAAKKKEIRDVTPSIEDFCIGLEDRKSLYASQNKADPDPRQRRCQGRCGRTGREAANGGSSSLGFLCVFAALREEFPQRRNGK